VGIHWLLVKDLNAALRQLQQYALALENPQLLIVSDMETIEIHTHFPNTVNVVHRLTLDDLADPAKPDLLRWAFLEPDRLQPTRTREAVTEIVPGYPDRLIPKPEHAAELKKRTLTHLYNQRPAWLDHAHRTLDEAVAAAYGWPADLSDDEVLRRLLALNRERTR
jgi:hypothetical protein